MGKKISQLTSEEFLDTLCAVTPYVTNITGDADLMNTIGKSIPRDGMTRAGVLLLGAEKLGSMVPIIAKTHRADVYGIIAAVNGVEPEEIANQNALKTAMQIRDIVRDKELLSFFKSFAESEQTAS